MFGVSEVFAGIRIVESPLCEMRVPVRKHKHRRGQSPAYHARIQKKWTKRFGMKLERVALIFNPSSDGGWIGQEFIALHPKDYAVIRNIPC